MARASERARGSTWTWIHGRGYLLHALPCRIDGGHNHSLIRFASPKPREPATLFRVPQLLQTHPESSFGNVERKRKLILLRCLRLVSPPPGDQQHRACALQTYILRAAQEGGGCKGRHTPLVRTSSTDTDLPQRQAARDVRRVPRAPGSGPTSPGQHWGGQDARRRTRSPAYGRRGAAGTAHRHGELKTRWARHVRMPSQSRWHGGSHRTWSGAHAAARHTHSAAAMASGSSRLAIVWP